MPAPQHALKAPFKMATKDTKVFSGAATRTPKGFKKIIAVSTAMGIDQHGQSPTDAAVKAVRTAMEQVSLPAALDLAPNGAEGVKAKIKIATPNPKGVDVDALKKIVPYSSVDVKVVGGGMRWHSGIAVPKLGDPAADAEIDAETSDDECASITSPDEFQVAIASVRIGF